MCNIMSIPLKKNAFHDLG